MKQYRRCFRMVSRIKRIVGFLLLIAGGDYIHAAEPNYAYAVEQGVLTVFGFALQSPEIGASSDNYQVWFRESPDRRKLLIAYVEPLQTALFWLYSDDSRVPIPLMDAQSGRHIDAEWLGNNVIAITGQGMGYRISKLFTTDNPNTYVRVNELIKYDADKDVYVRLERDESLNYSLRVGRIKSVVKEVEYPIPLYDQDLVGAIGYVKSVELDGRELIVKYLDNNESEIVERLSLEFLK